MEKNQKPGILENIWLQVWNLTLSKMGPGIRRQRRGWGIKLRGCHLKQKLVQVSRGETLTWVQLLVWNPPFFVLWVYACCLLVYIPLHWYRRIMIPDASGEEAAPLLVMYINTRQGNFDLNFLTLPRERSCHFWTCELSRILFMLSSRVGWWAAPATSQQSLERLQNDGGGWKAGALIAVLTMFCTTGRRELDWCHQIPMKWLLLDFHAPSSPRKVEKCLDTQHSWTVFPPYICVPSVFRAVGRGARSWLTWAPPCLRSCGQFPFSVCHLKAEKGEQGRWTALVYWLCLSAISETFGPWAKRVGHHGGTRRYRWLHTYKRIF